MRTVLVLAPCLVLASCLLLPLLPAPPAWAVSDPGSTPGPAGGSERGHEAYAPPVERPVRDPFRPPATRYGPGNRGLEYATVPGDVARAIGPGVVSFAGPVAGRLAVTVVHPDGLRSSLTGLVTVLVRPGQRVRRGTPLGAAGTALHLGVRDGDRYIDPASLFSRPRHAVLVPIPG